MIVNKWVARNGSDSNANGTMLQRLLANRGFADQAQIDAYLSPSLRDLHDPFLLLGMHRTIERIKTALQRDEAIVIYGDYDVDGITSSTIMVRALRKLGATVSYYIPRRLEEGYGLNGQALEKLANEGAALVITVDCGISAIEEAKLAKSLGIDLIISDHHQAPQILPDCYAIVNPQQPECQYPYNKLAGAGVALKIVQALLGVDDPLFKSLIVLAAVGTIADIMPLTGENRVIAQYGLEHFWQADLCGLQELAKVAGLAGKPINAGHIGFVIGPRLNAAGRIGTAMRAVDMLLSDDMTFVRAAAKSLDDLNGERRETESKILGQAIAAIESSAVHMSSGTIVVWGEGWHHGVIGIVASRLVERYYRPCIVFTLEDGTLKGSARSIAGYSIYHALSSQSHLLEKFGGHEQAAGLTLAQSNLQALIAGLAEYNKEYLLPELCFPQIKVDDTIASSDINHATIDRLEQMQPFGVANARPVFRLNYMVAERARRIGKDGAHLKMVLNSNDKLLDVIQFNYSEQRPLPPYHCRVDSVFSLAINAFNGVESIQLNQQDVRLYLPQDNAISRQCYAIYCAALVNIIMSGGHIETYSRAELRAEQNVVAWLSDDRPVAISSFEALLEYAYACFDRNVDYTAHIAAGKVKVLPQTIAYDWIVADVPLAGKRDSQLCYHHPQDHRYLLQEMGEIFFDRQIFSQIYRKICNEKSIDMIELLQKSKHILLTRLALAFFEEAEFITIDGNRVHMVEGEHNKYNFSGSQVQQKFDQFKRRLYELSVDEQSLMP